MKQNKVKNNFKKNVAYLYTYPDVFRSTFENQSCVDLRDNTMLRYIQLRHKVLTSI